MSGRGILDADMTTLAGWLRDGLRWWLDELRALVPASLREGGRSRARVLPWDGGALIGAAPGASVAIALDPALCLVRTIERPAMGERDLERMIALDADRILPLPAETVVVASRVAARTGATARVAVAALPRERAEALVSAVALAQVLPVDVHLDTDDGPIAFLPALRRAGLMVRGRGAARGWWAAVAFLFLLNAALLIWRDVARNERLAAVVEGQRPAVAAARRITARVRSGQRIAHASLIRRQANDPLWVMGQVATALPPGVWLQRYGWTAESLRLAGYRPRGADVVRSLRAAPGFIEVRNTNADTVAEVPAGQPFDVTARVRKPRP